LNGRSRRKQSGELAGENNRFWGVYIFGGTFVNSPWFMLVPEVLWAIIGEGGLPLWYVELGGGSWEIVDVPPGFPPEWEVDNNAWNFTLAAREVGAWYLPEYPHEPLPP